MKPMKLAGNRGAANMEPREKILMQELSQVYYIASRSRERLPRHIELDDLVSAGMVGLLEALKSYDGSKQVMFKRFARFRIRGAILDSLREVDWGSRSLRRKAREITDAQARLRARLCRQPDEAEVAEEMHLETAHLQKILAELDGLQLPVQQFTASSDGSELLDLIELAPNKQDEPNPFDLCLQDELKGHLARAMSKLAERDRLVVTLYYREDLTMKEIAELMGVGLSRVSQIHRAAIIKLRELLIALRTPPPPHKVQRASPNHPYA